MPPFFNCFFWRRKAPFSRINNPLVSQKAKKAKKQQQNQACYYGFESSSYSEEKKQTRLIRKRTATVLCFVENKPKFGMLGDVWQNAKASSRLRPSLCRMRKGALSRWHIWWAWTGLYRWLPLIILQIYYSYRCTP